MATVKAECLDHAWQLTQHIDRPWTENAGIDTLHVPANSVRSTDVGDVIADEAGDYWQVAGMGFTKVTMPEWLRF